MSNLTHALVTPRFRLELERVPGARLQTVLLAEAGCPPTRPG